jgi:formate dehydrogenase (NADP+) beta subunit
VELGFHAEQTAREVQRCLNCDVETDFTAALHRMRRLHRYLPLLCLTITRDGEEDDLRQRLSARPSIRSGALRLGRRCRKPERSC